MTESLLGKCLTCEPSGRGKRLPWPELMAHLHTMHGVRPDAQPKGVSWTNSEIAGKAETFQIFEYPVEVDIGVAPPVRVIRRHRGRYKRD